MIFRRKVLLFILISVILSTGFTIFIKYLLNPGPMKPLKNEKIEHSMAKAYEDLSIKTKTSIEKLNKEKNDR